MLALQAKKLIRHVAWTALGVAREKGIQLANQELVMAKEQGGGRLHRLPFTTFGEIAALDLKATVYCSRCFQHRPIDPAAEHLRDHCFATARFRCCEIRYTGDVCGCLGSVAIKPSVLLPVGGKDTLAFLFCVTCEPSWEINHVPIDKPPWSAVDRSSNDRFRCPGCRKAVAGVFTGRHGARRVALGEKWQGWADLGGCPDGR